MKPLLVLLSPLLLAWPGSCQGLSASKLSLHLIGPYTPGAREVLRAGPPVLKVLDLGPNMLAALRDYKTRWPQGKTVVRIYTEHRCRVDSNPTAAGREWWDTVLAPAVGGLSPADRKLIDYLEGPNECEHYPAWESVRNASWCARFNEALVPLIFAAGFRPCVGNIPVGNPPGTPQEIEERILAFAPALLAAHRLGGAWSYHAYTLAYTTDLGEELWTSLRYRRLHDAVARRFPELAAMPLILTEGGVDRAGNPQTDGWQARGGAGRYEAWLAWFDARLREDPYVVGITLFQCGDTRGWPSFDTEPINGWLARHLRPG